MIYPDHNPRCLVCNKLSKHFICIQCKETIDKNQEIVERVKEWADKVKRMGWDDADVPPSVFQSILGEKKDG